MCDWHAPLFVISYLPNLVFVGYGRLSYTAIINNLMDFVFFMTSGLLINGKWIFTCISMLITFLCFILFYAI